MRGPKAKVLLGVFLALFIVLQTSCGSSALTSTKGDNNAPAVQQGDAQDPVKGDNNIPAGQQSGIQNPVKDLPPRIVQEDKKPAPLDCSKTPKATPCQTNHGP